MTAITVLMAVHNGEQFLEEACQSVLGQDWHDFELLIVDDASTDVTSGILERLRRGDPRIRVIRNDANAGLTVSLNRGLREARGELVARIDADDLCTPCRLSLQKRYLDQHPLFTVVGSAATLVDETGAVAGRERPGYTEGEVLANMFFSNPLTHSSVMFRRADIVALGSYDESFARAQDYDLWLRCVAAGKKIGLLPEALVSHRLHDGRVTLRQSEVMENCRQRAVSRGLRDILGIEVSVERLGSIRELRFRERHATIREALRVCDFFRRMRRAFDKRFGAVPGCVPAFDAMVKRIVANIAQPEHPPLALMQAYATGSPLRRVGADYIRLGTSRGVSAIMVRAGSVRRSLAQRRR